MSKTTTKSNAQRNAEAIRDAAAYKDARRAKEADYTELFEALGRLSEPRTPRGTDPAIFLWFK